METAGKTESGNKKSKRQGFKNKISDSDWKWWTAKRRVLWVSLSHWTLQTQAFKLLLPYPTEAQRQVFIHMKKEHILLFLRIKWAYFPTSVNANFSAMTRPFIWTLRYRWCRFLFMRSATFFFREATSQVVDTQKIAHFSRSRRILRRWAVEHRWKDPASRVNLYNENDLRTSCAAGTECTECTAASESTRGKGEGGEGGDLDFADCGVTARWRM